MKKSHVTILYIEGTISKDEEENSIDVAMALRQSYEYSLFRKRADAKILRTSLAYRFIVKLFLSLSLVSWFSLSDQSFSIDSCSLGM